MKILVFSWLREYTLSDVLEAFEQLKIPYDKVCFNTLGKDKSDCPELYEFISESISKDNFDAVFSINYFPDVAKACFNKSILYISWSYDCPLDIRDIENTICLPTNRAFFFDKTQYLEYKNDNNTVFHAPLGINSSRLSNIQFNKQYSSDISFVGKIYHSTFPVLEKHLDDYYTGYLKGLIDSQKKVYGAYLIKEVLSDETVKKINYNLRKNNCPYTKDNYDLSLKQIAFSLVTEATFENRLLILALLSSKFDLKWYTTPECESHPNVKKCPPVDYYNEMPQVFKSSKINLHIGLHAIPSGISLRQIDILACGGFLLSSYQPELFDYFIPGEDFDFFTTVEEAYEKCSFYLSHEELRKKIALSGFEKSHQCFDNQLIISEIFDQSFS